jgi:hypothetical protein
MSKSHFYLVLVWSLICASGLGIFLFQTFGPRIDIGGGDDGALNPAVAVGFWVFIWAAPVLVLTIVSRRREG